MVVKEDGSKWACASCLKGHRVSGCTHVDRELTFVPKKGRPVTQCPHCRSERKKRSAHVKCECGEKPHPKEKCIHLREAEAKAAAVAATTTTPTTTASTTTTTVGTTTGSTGAVNTPDFKCEEPHATVHELGPLAEELFADEHHCCCPHGGKCICATLCKESPEPRGESPPKFSHPRPKPRLTSHSSDGHLTVFANGHHKPVHRNNNAAHECGAPYKLPRAHTTQGVPNMARRSVDSLASVQSMSPISWQQPPSSTSTSAAIQEPVKVQSERGSPQSEHQSNSHQSAFDVSIPLDSTTSFAAPEPSTSVSTVFPDFGFPSTQSTLSVATGSTEPSMSAFSMPPSTTEFGGNTVDFWSNLDWNRLETSNVDTQPALTNASSGTISEIDDLPRVDDLSGFEAQYSMDGQAQMSQFEFGNDYTETSNYGGNINVNTNSSNRWSMPAVSTQGGSNGFLPLTADTSAKEISMQSFGVVQQALSTQPMAISVANSTHSQSPAPPTSDSMFRGKETSMENFDWDSLMPEYSSSMISSNDVVGDTLGFTVNTSTQPSVATSQANSVQGGGSLEGFNNSYRTMQWDDGMSMPADQDYVDAYNFDTNWATGSFSNAWS